jgi:CotH kinase protein/Secretion system C-terminal sorting domain
MKKSVTLFAFLLFCSITNAQTNHWETAVYENDTWRYVVPTSEPDTNWRKITFNASSWLQGPGGFGFGDGDDNTVISTTTSVYTRITFNITDTSKISHAILNIDYDDGFVAYLNNVEIARNGVNTVGPPPYNTLASINHEAAMYGGGDPDYYQVLQSPLHAIIRPGLNVLSIQTHNVTANSSDLSSRTWLTFGIRDNSVLYGPTPSWFVAPLIFTDSNMPIVVINTNNQPILQTGKIMADMGIIYNGVGNRNYMNGPYTNYNGKIGIEVRGNYSASLPQLPYDFETRDVNGNGINVSLLGMPAENDWCLVAMYNDKSFMRNSLSYYMFQEMGHWAARSQLCEVVLNGEYQGVYALCETIKRDVNRVDIAKLLVTDITWPNVSGGYILKTDYWDNVNSWQLSYSPIDHPGLDVHLVYVYPGPDTLVPQQKTYIQNYVYDYETALYGPNFEDTGVGYRRYISERSFIDYFIVNELSRNVDGFKKSSYYYKEKDPSATAYGKLKAGPVWDFDWAWKDIWDCSIFQATDGSGWAHHINDCSPDINGTGWYVRLLQDSTFDDELQCRWTELRGTILDTASLFQWMDSIANYANEAQARHYQYWGHMGQGTGTPEVTAPRQSYQEEVDSLKSWILRRINWLDDSIPGTLAGCNITGIPSTANAVSYDLSTYPNPFQTQLQLDIYMMQSTDVKVEFFNVMGQSVQTTQVFQHSGNGSQLFTVMPPADLPPGMYLMRISAGGRVWTRQITKTE